jgi:hypothetical protein
MLIQDQVAVFQWLLYIKYGGPRLARWVTATLLRHSTAERLPTPGQGLQNESSVPVCSSTKGNEGHRDAKLIRDYGENIKVTVRATQNTATNCFLTINGDTHQTIGARCWWRIWLRHCATNRKVAGPIPDGVTGIFHWHKPSSRTMPQPLTKMSNRNVCWG